MDAEDLKSPRRFRLIYFATAAGTVLWLAAILAAPYFRSRGFGAAGFFYLCFAPTCHQIPARSFFLWSFPLAVCARCFGIYAGFAAGLIAYPFRKGFSAPALPSLKTFILVSLPIVIDTGANFLKIWNTGNAFRFLTGLLWGAILPLYWFAGLAGLFSLRAADAARRPKTTSDPIQAGHPRTTRILPRNKSVLK